MIDDERSAEARAVAELALIRLLTGSAPTSELLIVLGGLIPPTLTSTVPTAPAHLGTTDVDVLLVTHLTAGRDLSPIERALEAMDFESVGDGWRWRGVVDRHPDGLLGAARPQPPRHRQRRARVPRHDPARA
jgi:hypothetical protein